MVNTVRVIRGVHRLCKFARLQLSQLARGQWSVRMMTSDLSEGHARLSLG